MIGWIVDHSLIPHRVGGRIPENSPLRVARVFGALVCLWDGVWPIEPPAFWLLMSPCAALCAPFPVPPRVKVIAVIHVEKVLCMVLRIHRLEFPEIVPAHISHIVFSTMADWKRVGKTGRLYA